MSKLYYNTTEPALQSALKLLMSAEEFSEFRLVGGTSLSLQIGHRKSVDIDLFTDAEYNSIDFKKLDNFLKNNFQYVDSFDNSIIGMGKTYFIGKKTPNEVKLDLFYTDTFIRSLLEFDGIRLATLTDIAAMKLDVIERGGRKKDFWDIHALLEKFSLLEMISFHKERHIYTHSQEKLITQLTNFSQADDDPNPDCLQGKFWEVVKLDISDEAGKIK